MPPRKEILANNNIYHIYNKGVAGMTIFENKTDYKRFVDLFNYYRFCDLSLSYSALCSLSRENRENVRKNLLDKSDRLVEIYSYYLMPNHYHLLI